MVLKWKDGLLDMSHRVDLGGRVWLAGGLACHGEKAMRCTRESMMMHLVAPCSKHMYCSKHKQCV